MMIFDVYLWGLALMFCFVLYTIKIAEKRGIPVPTVLSDNVAYAAFAASVVWPFTLAAMVIMWWEQR